MRFIIVTIQGNRVVGVYNNYLEARRVLNKMDLKFRCDHIIKGVQRIK